MTIFLGYIIETKTPSDYLRKEIKITPRQGDVLILIDLQSRYHVLFINKSLLDLASWAELIELECFTNALVQFNSDRIIMSFDMSEGRFGSIKTLESLLSSSREPAVRGLLKNSIDLLNFRTEKWDSAVLMNIFQKVSSNSYVVPEITNSESKINADRFTVSSFDKMFSDDFRRFSNLNISKYSKVSFLVRVGVISEACYNFCNSNNIDTVETIVKVYEIDGNFTKLKNDSEKIEQELSALLLYSEKRGWVKLHPNITGAIEYSKANRATGFHNLFLKSLEEIKERKGSASLNNDNISVLIDVKKRNARKDILKNNDNLEPSSRKEINSKEGIEKDDNGIEHLHENTKDLEVTTPVNQDKISVPRKNDRGKKDVLSFNKWCSTRYVAINGDIIEKSVHKVYSKLGLLRTWKVSQLLRLGIINVQTFRICFSNNINTVKDIINIYVENGNFDTVKNINVSSVKTFRNIVLYAAEKNWITLITPNRAEFISLNAQSASMEEKDKRSSQVESFERNVESINPGKKNDNLLNSGAHEKYTAVLGDYLEYSDLMYLGSILNLKKDSSVDFLKQKRVFDEATALFCKKNNILTIEDILNYYSSNGNFTSLSGDSKEIESYLKKIILLGTSKGWIKLLRANQIISPNAKATVIYDSDDKNSVDGSIKNTPNKKTEEQTDDHKGKRRSIDYMHKKYIAVKGDIVEDYEQLGLGEHKIIPSRKIENCIFLTEDTKAFCKRNGIERVSDILSIYTEFGHFKHLIGCSNTICLDIKKIIIYCSNWQWTRLREDRNEKVLSIENKNKNSLLSNNQEGIIKEISSNKEEPNEDYANSEANVIVIDDNNKYYTVNNNQYRIENAPNHICIFDENNALRYSNTGRAFLINGNLYKIYKTYNVMTICPIVLGHNHFFEALAPIVEINHKSELLKNIQDIKIKDISWSLKNINVEKGVIVYKNTVYNIQGQYIRNLVETPIKACIFAKNKIKIIKNGKEEFVIQKANKTISSISLQSDLGIILDTHKIDSFIIYKTKKGKHFYVRIQNMTKIYTEHGGFITDRK